MWEMGSFDFDIGVVCHHHEATFESFFKHNQQRWAVRTGTYKTYDEYSDKVGFGGTTVNHLLPTAIFSPYTKKVEMVGSIDSAIKLIT